MKTMEEKCSAAALRIKELSKKLKAAEHLLEIKQQQLVKERARLAANLQFTAYFICKAGKTQIPYDELKSAAADRVRMRYDPDKRVITAQYLEDKDKKD